MICAPMSVKQPTTRGDWRRVWCSEMCAMIGVTVLYPGELETVKSVKDGGRIEKCCGGRDCCEKATH